MTGSSNGHVKTFTAFKGRARSSASSRVKKTKNKKTRDHYSPDKEPEEHEILTALSMSQDLADQFQQILKKLEKIDTIELSLKKTESKLKNLPYCVKFW